MIEHKAVCFEVEGARYYSPRVEVDAEALTFTPVEPFRLVE